MIPEPQSRTAMLRGLQDEIESALGENAWLFPERRSVGGFYGTGSLVIVGLRPGMGSFADVGENKLFYEILAEEGLERAHLTNYIKTRGRKGDPLPDDLVVHQGFFRRELDIVLGRDCVATMGQDAHEVLGEYLKSIGRQPIFRLVQYASMKYGSEDRFRAEIRSLAQLVQRNGCQP